MCNLYEYHVVTLDNHQIQPIQQFLITLTPTHQFPWCEIRNQNLPVHTFPNIYLNKSPWSMPRLIQWYEKRKKKKNINKRIKKTERV